MIQKRKPMMKMSSEPAQPTRAKRGAFIFSAGHCCPPNTHSIHVILCAGNQYKALMIVPEFTGLTFGVYYRMGSPLTTRRTAPLPSLVSIVLSYAVYSHQYGPVSSMVRLIMRRSKLGNTPVICSLPSTSLEMVAALVLVPVARTSFLWRPLLRLSRFCSETAVLQWMVKDSPRSFHTTPPSSVRKTCRFVQRY